VLAWPLVARAAGAQTPQVLTFPSTDSLPVTADLYAPYGKQAPLIVLFHQAGWSRGEYREIAPRLAAMGFNCLAVDLRSGDAVNGVVNETARRARDEGRPAGMLEAGRDVEAALRFARARLARGTLLAWGSSYSASLVLRLAGERPGIVDGLVVFSPGEYFTSPPGGPSYVADAARRIAVPVFVTSARSEQKEWQPIYAAIPSSLKRAYVPDTEGRHGSSALWKSTNGQEGYWQAIRGFLNRRFSRAGS
jgi:dienelactone hydrolase